MRDQLRGLKAFGAIFLLLLSGASTSCQVVSGWDSLVHREAQAASMPSALPATPTAVRLMATPARTTPASASPATPYRTIAPTPPVPVSPETTGSPSPPRGEIDAESKVVPVIKAGLPQGPRKPPAIRIIIPSIALDVKVIELGTYVNQEGETVWETAPYVVGHHKGTANPGEPGNVVLSGHISSIREGAIFKRLPEVEVRDAVILVTDDRNYIYQVVDKKTVEPTDIGVMFSSGEKLLTLITCVPDGVYTHRLVITARQI